MAKAMHAAGKQSASAKPMLFGELTSADIAKLVRSKRKPIVILPMGATEAHGQHLPVWTDAITPYELAKRVSARTGALVLPPINYGFCYTLRPWAGTLSVRSETFAHTVRDITSELVRNGFDKMLFLNGHGANATIAGHVLKELADDKKFTACVVSWWTIKELDKVCGETGHADENEESIVMALTGWKKRPCKQAKSQRYFGRVIPMPKDQFTRYGYAGNVKNGTLARGRKMEKIIVDKLVKLVKANLLLKE